MIPESDHWGEYKSCALGCGYVSYPEPPDYSLPTNRGRKAERLIGRPKRGGAAGRTRGVLGSKT